MGEDDQIPVIQPGDKLYRMAFDRLSETDRSYPCVFTKVYEELDRTFPMWILRSRGMEILRGYKTDPDVVVGSQTEVYFRVKR